MIRRRSLHDLVLAIAVALSLTWPVTSKAQSDALEYVVEMQVASDYRDLLENHLELFTSRLNPRMNEDQLRFMVSRTPEQVRELLSTEGYFSPLIDVSLQETDGSRVVRLKVEPGAPVRVARVDLQLRGEMSLSERDARLGRIRDGWPLQAGMIFRQARWEQAKRGALQELLTGQHPAARISSSRASVDTRSGEASLHVELDSGPAFSFGALDISGLQRYPRSIVERLNDIEPGAPYSQAKLLQLQSRLQDTRYFSSALVSADSDPTRPEKVPVKVRVVEAPSRKVGFGAGVSTNTGARGQVEYQDLNFLDRAWRLSNLLKLESKKQLLKGDLQFPRASEGYVDSVTALTERTDIEREVTRKHALGARRAFVVGDVETALGLQFQTEREEIAGLQADKRQALVANYSWTKRKVNNLLYPTDGFLLSAQVGAAAKAVLSDQDFVRTHAKVTYYTSVGDKAGLILRGEAGATLARSRQGIPADYLFRAGGDQSVRGYGYQSLGVRRGDAIVGGRYLGVASAEFVQWLAPEWGAALFYDAGTATDDRHEFKPVRGYGAGARWKSPVGLLNLDLAYGRDIGRLRLHFSVGISF